MHYGFQMKCLSIILLFSPLSITPRFPPLKLTFSWRGRYYWHSPKTWTWEDKVIPPVYVIILLPPSGITVTVPPSHPPPPPKRPPELIIGAPIFLGVFCSNLNEIISVALDSMWDGLNIILGICSPISITSSLVNFYIDEVSSCRVEGLPSRFNGRIN